MTSSPTRGPAKMSEDRTKRNPASREQRSASSLVTALRDLEDEILHRAAQLPGQQPFALDAADLGHRTLRAPIVLADPEDRGVGEGEGVVEHQALDLAVGRAAPMAAGDERPADLDFAALGLVAVVTA